jgi:hypothetical protein
VRKAFLCGIDSTTGENYEHCWKWVDSATLELTIIFVIEICAYAIMSNRLYVVIKVNAYKAALLQWHKGFKGTLLTKTFVNHEDLNDFELGTVNDCIT